MSVKTCNGAVAQHDHGMVISLLRVLFPIFLVLVIPSKAVYAFQFPNITSVTPNFGPVTGGNTITINGTGFGAIQGDGDVAINGRLCTNYTWSDTQVTCTVPAGATTGEFSLDLLTAGLIISNPVAYTYLGPTQITAIDPTEGPTSGGNTITINGANFGLSQVDGFVQIGSNQCSNYTWSNTQVSCTVPAGTPGDATLSLSIGGVSTDSPVPYVYNTFPTITSVSPTEGPTSGGNTITINGSDFGANQNGGSVTIGAFACTDYTWSDTQVTCTVPAGAPGNAPLVLTIGAGFATNTVNYFYNTFPAITSIAPTEGPTAGGNTITINGSDFGANQNGGKVTIGPNDCTDYTWSDTQVTCTVPAGTTGNADVVLTIGAGFSTPPVTYFYNTLPTISSVSPTEGPTAGGNTITINGSAFGATQDGGQVTIGNNACTNYTWSDTQVTCTVPAGITGFADLVLTIGAGFSTVPINYFYNTLPAISSISPTEGPTAGGNTITINGSNFGANQNGGKVTIGFNDCTDYTWSDTQVTCTVPAGVTGNADLVLTIGAGFLTPPVPYLYNTPPAISSISPTEGAASGGNTITINGSNFGATQNGGSVTIGNNACTNYTWSDTQVTCTVPAGTPGSANLVLTIGAGFSSGAVTYLYLSDPIITFINPTQGPAAGGNTITISGSNFGAIQGGGSVDIGGNACSNYSWSDTQITCTVPAGNAGNANLNLTTASGVFSNTVTYTYVGVPTITSINPAQGPATGGNTITIGGSNFGTIQGGGNVDIGGNACSNYSWSDTQITCTVPAGNAGNANLNLTTASGTFSNTVSYTYVGVPTITLINPTQGPAAGGNTITISGSNFGAIQGGGNVDIGGNACSNYSWSDTQITCTVPAGNAGNANLNLTTASGGFSNIVTYTYVSVPTITLINPTQGPAAGGNTITISGSNFGAVQGGGNVDIGGNACSNYSWSDTQVTCTVPAGNAGNANLNLTTASGGFSNTVTYTYVGVPTIISINPTQGPAAGGNTITISGSNFGAIQGGGNVDIGGNACSNYSWSDTQITCTVPAGNAGNANLNLTTASGTFSNTVTYTYVGVPTITSINPTQGPAAGGNTITISGSNFGAIQGGGNVDIGGNACSNYSWSDTQVTCTVPAGNPGNANLNLTTASGTFSNTVTYIYVGVPTITFINPTQGPAAGGNTITISGSNFGAIQGGGNVDIGGNACSNYSWSDTQITCTVPAGNAGNANLTLTTASGGFSNTVTYTYVGVPTITSINPTQGPAAGGNTITISGSNFGAVQGGGNVAIGGDVCSNYSWSDTQITCTVPAGNAGNAELKLITGGGFFANTVNYLYIGIPVITSISPTEGPITGGNTLTIKGADFGVNQNGGSVTIGGNACTDYNWSDAQITCIVPAGTIGPASVEVRVQNFSSDPATYTYTAALPVELLSFTGILRDGRALLSWSTGSESNNQGFVIERSADGKQWRSIGFVNGHGNSNSSIDYSYQDQSPLLGDNYYRLRQLDFDGQFSFSPVVFVRNVVTQALRLYPNPVGDELYVIAEKGLPYRIMDTAGRVYRNGSIDGEPIDLKLLPTGLYYIRVGAVVRAFVRK